MTRNGVYHYNDIKVLKIERPSSEAIIIPIYKNSLLYKQILEYYRNYVNNNPFSTIDMIRVGGLNSRDNDKISSEKNTI